MFLIYYITITKEFNMQFFKKFLALQKVKYTLKHGSNREKIEIYKDALADLKEKLLLSIDNKDYKTTFDLLNKGENIRTNIGFISLEYTLNRGFRINQEVDSKYDFPNMILKHIKENKDANLLEFLRSKNCYFVKGFHLKGVRRPLY